MYPTQPKGAEGATLNLAAINPADLLTTASRGVKRSRSPEQQYREPGLVGLAGDEDSEKPRKRGRPMKLKSGTMSEPASQASPSAGAQPAPGPPQTPHAQQTPQTSTYRPAPPVQAQQAQQTSPPPKPAAAKSTLKALPTVRDHTTDQLGPGGDEYIPRETDEAGEKKVLPNGQLTGNREYKCRTFLVPQRGDKLFMLATECARVLNYRDSYLLFNKNRSLHKIIANQLEKDDLVNHEILPFSYRSRQIAIVTARSMFRQFGSRVIQNGRRVRDDYWESKARKQGFTEADLAGEKRPGGSKAREAAAEAAQHASILGGPQGEVIYSQTPGQFGPGQRPPLAQTDYVDTNRRDYSSILKTGPRQEITGPPYQDRTQPSPITEINAQAHQAAEFNRSVNQQRQMRTDYLQDIWRTPHEQRPSQQIVASGAAGEVIPSIAPPPTTSRAAPSPHTTGSLLPTQQSPQIMMTAPPYAQAMQAQNPGIGQNPMRGSARTSWSGAGSIPQLQSYSYPGQGQMWPPTPHTPQASYAAYTTQAQASPLPSHHTQQQTQTQQQQSHHQQQHQQHRSPAMGTPQMAQHSGPAQQQQQPQPPPQQHHQHQQQPQPQQQQPQHQQQPQQQPQPQQPSQQPAHQQPQHQQPSISTSMSYAGLPGMGYAPAGSAAVYKQTPRGFVVPGAGASPAAQAWPQQPHQPTQPQWWTNPQQQ